jgi:hypothetical protein
MEELKERVTKIMEGYTCNKVKWFPVYEEL